MLFVGKRDQNLGIRKRTVEKRYFLGPTSLKVVILVVLAAFSLFYLSQSTQSATKNYEISDLNQQNQDLNAQKDRLEVEANRLKALSIIQDKASKKSMEQVSQ